MAIGGTYCSSSTNGLVKCSENGWSLTVVDAKTEHTGYMVSGTNVLSNKLQISQNGSSYQDADTPLTLVENGTHTGEDGYTFRIYVEQQVTYDDTVATGYSITLTFTAAVTI
jgi:hypothetical protein